MEIDMPSGDVPGQAPAPKARRLKGAWIAATVLAALAALGVGATLPNAGAQIEQVQEQQAPDSDPESDGSADCDGPGHHGFGGLELFSTAAETIGVDEDTLRDELASGKSLAQVAEEHNVSAQALTDALVAAANARIDEKVAAGDLTADEAAEKKAEVADRIADMIQQTGFPGRGGRPHGFGGHDSVDEGDVEQSAFERA